MRAALTLANEAFDRGEVPVGALIVMDNCILAKASNRVEENFDPTAHAEIEAIRAACRIKGNWRLEGADLYTTLEPCAMCLGAAIASRCKSVIWAAADLRQGAAGSWCHLLDKQHPIHNPKLSGGCLGHQSAKLMRDFFRLRRAEKGGLSG